MTDQGTIAYLSSEYPAISHTFIYREILSLRSMGYTVKTITINPSRNLDRMTPDEQREANSTLCIKAIPVLKIVAVLLGFGLGKPLRGLKLYRNAMGLLRGSMARWVKKVAYCAEAILLVRWIAKAGVSHLHVHFANPAASVAMIAASLGTFTYSISVHGPDIFFDIEGNALKRKIDQAVGIRCISYYCRSQLMRLTDPEDWEKFRIVRCGILSETYSERRDPGNRIPELLCVGRLVPAKGQHILLLAAEKLISRGIEFHLTFVGDGPDRRGLETIVKNRGWDDVVEFTGAVGQDEIHRYYDRADIFVLPSFAEGLPVVLMESMAKGIATVSTYINGIPELMVDRRNGRLCHASDIDSLFEILRELISDPDQRKRLAKAGRETVLQKYDLHRNSMGMADFFQEYLQKKPNETVLDTRSTDVS